jgi:hypothetical protein
MMRRICITICLALTLAFPAYAAGQAPSPAFDVEILSPSQLNGTAGDFVEVQADITNNGVDPISNITTYLSLVDNETHMPVDLEDWSAEKGLFIGTIDAGQVFPLNWKVHFVKAGNYSLSIVAIVEGQDTPQVSTLVNFDVVPKRNLNPGMVLPVALGEPVILLILMLILIGRRKTDE